jgi:hypothetical protein
MVIRLELADLELFASGKGEDDDERECGYPKTVCLSSKHPDLLITTYLSF